MGRLLPARFLLFFAAYVTAAFLHAAEAPVSYTRFCASCGVKDIDSFLSHSGQFVVHGSVGRGFVPRVPGTNTVEYITVEPQLVALMGERVSRTLSRELQLPDRFADKVHVTVFNFAPPGQPIGLITQIHSDGFAYKMSMPGRAEGTQVLKGLLQVLLQEYANRGHRRAAELPHWLVEGMLRQMQTAVVPTYIVNRKPITIERTGYDRLGITRAYLQTNAPMTLQELSFADLTKVTEAQRDQFEASAHLLVHQLLRLKGGPQLMARFLQTLPATLNWQTAFYAVYKQQFAGPLEFEKWWLLNWINFKNSHERENWTPEATLARLESVIYTTMELRADANSLPQYRDTPLQEFLQLADWDTQKEMLGQKVQQLLFMSMNVPPQVAPIWQGYSKALEHYLEKRANLTQPTPERGPEPRLQELLRATSSTLDGLDAMRAELEAAGGPVITNQQASR